MIEWYGRRWQQEKRVSWRKVKPIVKQDPALKWGKPQRKEEPENGQKRTADYAGQSRQTHEQQADFGHTWKRGTHKAQTSPACTQPIQDTVRSWVRGKKAWFGGGEREKTYFEVPTRALLGEVSCWNDIPPKEAKLSWNHQVHAMRDREREGTHTIAGKGATTNKQTNIVFFCLARGSDTQTDQWLSVSTPRPDKGG